MVSSDELLATWEGEIVPRTFNAGLVALSYCVSFIGAMSTLELINRRTSPKGLSNHLLLISAAVTMGGISIWAMHYLGNRAIQVHNNERELQIAYSPGFTAVSFFVPILVLLPAFVSAGSNNKVSWWRVVIGGSLAGAAVCGMHYLGNNSISNYSCEYKVANVVGSAIIAVVASNVALATFFVFRAAWTQSWWKRVASAIILAGAVSGMHWIASTGTEYRLVKLNNMTNTFSRNVTSIMIICLSVGACIIIAASSIYTARMVRRYATKAKQVTLASAIFDSRGRLLVTTEGLLPIETITDSFPERSASDMLSEAHPLFLWMFQASRNWPVLAPLVRNTQAHLQSIPPHTYDTIDGELRLVDSHAEVLERYDIIFKELFTVAANSLAETLKQPLTNMGVLWDSILITGTASSPLRRNKAIVDEEKGPRRSPDHGSLMFLTRSVSSDREAAELAAAGFRFAEPHHVASIIASSLRIKASDVNHAIQDMSRYGNQSNDTLMPGVHMGFFGIRARMQTQGFEVLVRKSARNMLPSTILPLDRLESDHIHFLARFDRMTTKAMLRMLENATAKLSPKEKSLSAALVDALNALRRQVDPAIFDEAMLIARPAELPCAAPLPGTASAAGDISGPEKSATATVSGPRPVCQMICLRTVVPIHYQQTISNDIDVEFIALNFFKLHQLMFPGSPYHLSFSRSVHRDVAPVVNAAAALPVTPVQKDKSGRRNFFGKGNSKNTAKTDADGNPIPTSLYRTASHHTNRTSSTLKLWPGPESSGAEENTHSTGLGGIMVSQEVVVQVGEEVVNEKDYVPTSPSGLEHIPGIPLIGEATLPGVQEEFTATGSMGIEMKNMQHGGVSGAGNKTVISGGDKLGDVRTYVDDLFAICVAQR